MSLRAERVRPCSVAFTLIELLLVVAGETGFHGTDYWAADNDIMVWGEDYPYGAIPAGWVVTFITKRHRYGFNVLRVSGAVHHFKWGASTPEDWRPQ